MRRTIVEGALFGLMLCGAWYFIDSYFGFDRPITSGKVVAVVVLFVLGHLIEDRLKRLGRA
jgi:hypothetical protein